MSTEAWLEKFFKRIEPILNPDKETILRQINDLQETAEAHGIVTEGKTIREIQDAIRKARKGIT